MERAKEEEEEEEESIIFALSQTYLTPAIKISSSVTLV